LEVEYELVLVERFADPQLHLQTLFGRHAHRVVEKLHPVTAVVLGLVHRGVGITQDGSR
jgi:hypothetical protein